MTPAAWIALLVIIVAMLGIDLYRHREAHAPTPKEAGIESTIWVMCGLAFSVVIAVMYGSAAFGEYISGYLIEKSLSVDNVFVLVDVVRDAGDPAEVPAPGAVLGHLRRARVAGRSSSCWAAR